MKWMVFAVILLPYLSFAQEKANDYAIYSQFLKAFQSKKKVKQIFFVIRDIADSSEYKNDEVASSISEITRYLNGDKSVTNNDVYFTFRDILQTLKKDSLWTPIIVKMGAKIQDKAKIGNKFSTDLLTAVIDNRAFNRYFQNSKHIDENWNRFHKQYPMPSALVSFSTIANDGTRAVFYYSIQCGGLCGEGGLAFLENENGKWKFLAKSTLWNN